MNVIEINNLCKYYDNTNKGIKNITLNVKKGDFFGLIGPNGAGKSTTIRIIMGLLNKTSGNVYINGEDISINSVDVRKEIGYLPSELSFYSSMKVKDILKFYLNLRGIYDLSYTYELCNKLDLNLDLKANELSLGNKKKVGIVCALQHKPNILILDEATSGLDPLIKRNFFLILKELNKTGVTILFSSHILKEIEEHCNSFASISKGEVKRIDRVDNISFLSSKLVTLTISNSNSKIAYILDKLLNELKQYNIRIIERENNKLKFYYDNDINKLINIISSYSLTNITIHDPELEDIFMDYYKE